MEIDDISFSPFDNKKEDKANNSEIKIMWLGLCSACFHLFLVALFLYMHSMPMAYFNVVSVLWYSLLIVVVKKKRSIIMAILMAFGEVIVHSIMACIFVGWNMHFQVYIFALIPACSYIIEKKSDILSGINAIVFASAVCCISYLLCYEASYTIVINVTYNKTLVDAVSYINFIIMFSFAGMATIIAAMDNYSRHLNLTIKERELDQLAQSDILTGLYNRSSMRTYFDQMQNSGKNYYIILADVDGLKSINDNYGREVGDLLLRNIARICVNEVSYNGYVSRWGNEEVLVLKEYEDINSAKKAIEHIRKTIQNSLVPFEKGTVGCTMSFGITAHTDGCGINESIGIARRAMEQAKQEGGNKTCVAIGEDHA